VSHLIINKKAEARMAAALPRFDQNAAVNQKLLLLN